MSDHIKYTTVVFTIICIITTIIIGLIARKTYSKTNNDRLVKIFYTMLIISLIMIEIVLRIYGILYHVNYFTYI